MNVAEQLQVMHMQLVERGWLYEGGGRYRHSKWRLNVSYRMGEATLELDREGSKGWIKGAHVRDAQDKLGMTVAKRTRWYRGDKPLTWVSTVSALPLRKIFSNQLDTLADRP